jgi:hypothetical protein
VLGIGLGRKSGENDESTIRGDPARAPEEPGSPGAEVGLPTVGLTEKSVSIDDRTGDHLDEH